LFQHYISRRHGARYCQISSWVLSAVSWDVLRKRHERRECDDFIAESLFGSDILGNVLDISPWMCRLTDGEASGKKD